MCDEFENKVPMVHIIPCSYMEISRGDKFFYSCVFCVLPFPAKWIIHCAENVGKPR